MSFKRGNLGTDMHTHRILFEGKSRDGDDISTSRGTPKLATKPGEGEGEAGN